MADSDPDFLAIGARAIAHHVFDDALNDKQVYRLNDKGGWPFIRVLNKLAMRRAAGRAEIERREQAARAAPAPERRNCKKQARARSSP